MQAAKVNPEWLTQALKNLSSIEDNVSDYEDPEEGDHAPTPEIFEAVRTFLFALKDEERLEVPRLFVSPDGLLVLSYGDKKRGVDIRFSPGLYFYFKQTTATGHNATERAGTADVLQLITKHFRL